MTANQLQLEIIACARSYIGTRFHHQGRLKRHGAGRGGIDCLGLLVGVAAELGLKDAYGRNLADFDQQNYSHQPDGKALTSRLETVLHKIAITELQPADVALFRIDGNDQHLGFVSPFGPGWGVIHAYAPARAVVEHALDDGWRKKIAGIYRLTSFFRA